MMTNQCRRSRSTPQCTPERQTLLMFVFCVGVSQKTTKKFTHKKLFCKNKRKSKKTNKQDALLICVYFMNRKDLKKRTVFFVAFFSLFPFFPFFFFKRVLVLLSNKTIVLHLVHKHHDYQNTCNFSSSFFIT